MSAIPVDDMHCSPEMQTKLDKFLAEYNDMLVTFGDALGYTETVKHTMFTTDGINLWH